MIVVPAIDLMGGKAVRLTRGERDQATVYSDDPPGLVARFAQAGARRIHIVDLDGAFEGRPAQRDVIAALATEARRLGTVIQTGGGIRDAATVESLFDAGVDQVVIGTLAIREPALVQRLCAAHPGQIIIAVDAREGRVAVSGWTEDSGIPVDVLARQAEDWGAGALLHTDVSRDGMQVGPALEATLAVQSNVRIPVFASGGVGTLEHLRACREAGIHGVIVGRAIYEGAFTVEEALAPC